MPPGEAGLATTRVECELRAPAALDRPATVRFEDSYLADRIGWREITAAGAGVRLAESTVPGGERERSSCGPTRSICWPTRSTCGRRPCRWSRAPAAAEPTVGPPAFAPVDRLRGRAERLVHRSRRPRRADRRGRPARGRAGARARGVARAAARSRQDGHGGVSGRPARDPPGRAARRRHRHRDPHRRGAGARRRWSACRQRSPRTACCAGSRCSAACSWPGSGVALLRSAARHAPGAEPVTGERVLVAAGVGHGHGHGTGTATATGTGMGTGTGRAAFRARRAGRPRRRGRAGAQPDGAAGPARRDRAGPDLVRHRARALLRARDGRHPHRRRAAARRPAGPAGTGPGLRRSAAPDRTG